MRVRAAVSGDADALGAFVGRVATRAMFIGDALRREGIGAQARFWLAEAREQVVAAMALNRSGIVTVAAEDAAGLPPGVASGFAHVLAGSALTGLNGADEAALPLARALGLDRGSARLDRADPHFALALDDLVIPAGAGTIRPVAEADRALLTEWRVAYEIEALGRADDPGTHHSAARSVSRMIDDVAAALLCEGPRGQGAPLALVAFNARAADAVQVGGVYVPPALRNRGYARRAVAQLLAGARAGGLRQGVLFAASDRAATAYRAIGFRRIGEYRLIDFAVPQMIGAAP